MDLNADGMTDIDRFLDEDLGQKGDITSDALFQDEPGKAVIIAIVDCVIAGLEEVRMVFQKTGAETHLLIQDGSMAKKGMNVAEINGPVRSILKGERLALNILGRMSGIASETRSLVDLCKNMNAQVTIAATRKTTPGFRAFEKKAVVLGGGEPHRLYQRGHRPRRVRRDWAGLLSGVEPRTGCSCVQRDLGAGDGCGTSSDARAR